MRVHLVQLRSEPGRVRENVARHLAALRAVAPGAGDLVAFPELSLSSYEPPIAEAAALTVDDARLRPLRAFADATGATIASGAPLRTSGRPRVALLVFAAGAEPTVIEKRHLHPDELRWFSAAEGAPAVLELERRVGVAICYELSVPEHAASLSALAPEIYLASVAKTSSGVAAAEATLTATARRYRIPVLLVNAVGACEGKSAGGRSLAIVSAGRVLARLGADTEGALVYDAAAGTATAVELDLPFGLAT